MALLLLDFLLLVSCLSPKKSVVGLGQRDKRDAVPSPRRLSLAPGAFLPSLHRDFRGVRSGRRRAEVGKLEEDARSVFDFLPESPPSFCGKAGHCSRGGVASILRMGRREEDPEEARRRMRAKIQVESKTLWRGPRFFVFLSMIGGGTTSTFITLAKLAAASAGINDDPASMTENFQNLAVNIPFILGGAFALSKELERDEQQIAAQKRALLLKDLQVEQTAVRPKDRMGTPLLEQIPSAYGDGEDDAPPQRVGGGQGGGGDSSSSESKKRARTIPLGSLMTGGKGGKRVVLVAGDADTVQLALDKAVMQKAPLIASDVLIVPLALSRTGVEGEGEEESVPSRVRMEVLEGSAKPELKDVYALQGLQEALFNRRVCFFVRSFVCMLSPCT
uniref:Uncharacterized protein n=1 Tax=Chromera velia CCMP2878 TaxID=1169474 RepID=A0A0K6S9C2_9ALVE|eukprot:Cvel_29926.t2-p1 / transcript=Cvel_29926.t2 / gene=Cvel_29926 / organism=Chromera_velia_CCMP2878 / gene_product=hypothetical protein / transcript_product=hypothetical protein / location=Cvel_scaffold4188:397-2747(-) / protein_length=389 / sequence_SO=supercontig / SO=protein_coding / is_pseudo=false